MSFIQRILVIAISGSVLLTCSTQAKAISGVVPGQSLGKIAIGEPRGQLLMAIKRKQTANYDLKNGLVEDEWTWRVPSKNDSMAKISVTVWYRKDKVVQIEMLDPPDSMSKLPSFNSLIDNNKNLKKVCYSVGCYTQNGEYDGGYILFYYDDVKRGIAYGASVQDDFILTSKPESITVHALGRPVIPFSGLTKVKLVTGAGAVDYRTKADAARARAAAT